MPFFCVSEYALNIPALVLLFTTFSLIATKIPA